MVTERKQPSMYFHFCIVPVYAEFPLLTGVTNKLGGSNVSITVFSPLILWDFFCIRNFLYSNLYRYDNFEKNLYLLPKFVVSFQSWHYIVNQLKNSCISVMIIERLYKFFTYFWYAGLGDWERFIGTNSSYFCGVLINTKPLLQKSKFCLIVIAHLFQFLVIEGNVNFCSYSYPFCI